MPHRTPPRNPAPTRAPRRVRDRRGTAYLLAMIAIAVAAALGVGFLRSANTSLAVATNVRAQPAARGLAETGMAVALRHVEQAADWRTGKTSGAWLSDVAWGEGTFAVRYTDDKDGDLGDSTLDDVTVEVIGRVGDISHRLTAEVAFSVPTPISVLYVAGSVPVSDLDGYRIEMLESWGMAVTTIDDDAADDTFDAAVDANDVVFVAASVRATKVEALLDNTATGVVLEEGAVQDHAGLSLGNAIASTSNSVYVADNLHPITRGLSLGSLKVLDKPGGLYRNGSDIAGDARFLATATKTGVTTVAGGYPLTDATSSPALYLLEAGSLDQQQNLVHGRRVAIPLAFDDVDVIDYSDDGAALVRRSIEWAAGGTVPHGYLAAWSFDETAGTALYDGIDDHHGLMLGSPTIDQPGVIDRAIDFDGSDDAVEVQHRPLLSPTDALSIAMWVQADVWTTGDHLISKGADDQYRLWLHDAGTLEFWLKGVGTISTPAPSAGVWQHVAATYDGDEMRLYVNGVLMTSAAVTGAIDTTTDALYLGSDGSQHYFDGRLDDVRLFGRALSHREVKWLHEQADATGLPRLVASYRFHEPPADSVPQLVSHWPLDDAGEGQGYSGPVGVALGGRLEMEGDALIDAYNVAAGGYDPGLTIDALVVTKMATSSPKAVSLANQATLQGDLVIGASGNVSTNVETRGTATITGDTLLATVDFTPPTFSLPGDFAAPAGTDEVYDGTSEEWTGDLSFTSLEARGGATITVKGQTRVQVEGDLILNDASIVLADGASLTLLLNNQATLLEDASIHADAGSPERVTLLFYGTDTTDSLTMNDRSAISGSVVGPYGLDMDNQSAIFGRVISRGDLTMSRNSAIHVADGLGDVIVAAGGTQGSDGSSPGTRDETGLSNGLPTNVTYHASGRHGDAFRFNGLDSYVVAPHHPAYLLDRGAVSFWFNADHTFTTPVLLAKRSDAGVTTGDLTIALVLDRLVMVMITADGFEYFETGGVTAGTWHHVALSFGPGGLRLYLDGVLAQSSSYTGGLGASSGTRGNEKPWMMGSLVTGLESMSSLDEVAKLVTGLLFSFDGRLDDVRVYNRPLDATQVDAVMRSNTPGVSPENDRVVDLSNAERPAHLPIDDPSGVAWLATDTLRVSGNVIAATPAAAPKLHANLTTTDQFTIYAAFAPDTTSSPGGRRVVTYSDSIASRNVSVGQAGTGMVTLLRAGSANNNGDPPMLASGTLAAHQFTRVVVTYDGSDVRLYIDGELVMLSPLPGNLNAFDPNMPFALFNEIGKERAWTGVIEAVDIYDTALEPSQIARIIRDLPPGPAPSTSGDDSIHVAWIEGQ
ncbi:MAG: LamG domain-containing protein [Planctomycetota bacterium]